MGPEVRGRHLRPGLRRAPRVRSRGGRPAGRRCSCGGGAGACARALEHPLRRGALQQLRGARALQRPADQQAEPGVHLLPVEDVDVPDARYFTALPCSTWRGRAGAQA